MTIRLAAAVAFAAAGLFAQSNPSYIQFTPSTTNESPVVKSARTGCPGTAMHNAVR